MVYGDDARVAAWVQARIPYQRFMPGAYRAIGIEHDGALVAGVVYERATQWHCEASIAADAGSAWATRQVLFHLFAYPFIQLGIEAVSVVIPGSNLESLNLATKLGFRGEAIIAFAAHDGSPLIVLKQFRQECRWISHEQEGRRQPADSTGPAEDGGGRGPVQPVEHLRA